MRISAPPAELTASTTQGVQITESGRFRVLSDTSTAALEKVPADGKAHCCVDMGEDEFTQGIPHPMIDLSQRQQRMLKDLRDPTVKVLLLDVVLGYGTHPDPAPELVATIKEGRAGIADGGPVVIGHVCGAQGDPQSLEAQEAALRAGGVFTFPTNAQAARAALALVS